jgi:hypothetical protein
MKWFMDFLKKSGPGEVRILDLGGQPEIWEDVERPLNITILNLPGIVVRPEASRHQFTYVVGDGCHVDQFADQSFDIVFSNSVIEHVGDQEHQLAFAREVQRLGKRYWLQTPSIYFPVEAHSGMPFWWFYPESIRQRLLKRWRLKLPEWTEMIEGTSVLTKEWLKHLFPDGELRTERVMGIPKSYTIHSR